jgi:NADH:ubiquinone oxidoreductase subunit
MGFFKRIFTWWEGASFGAGMHIRRTGREVGRDHHGNVYYRSKKGDRRYVIYNGPNDASRIPPEWYAWMHKQIDDVPDEACRRAQVPGRTRAEPDRHALCLPPLRVAGARRQPPSGERRLSGVTPD